MTLGPPIKPKPPPKKPDWIPDPDNPLLEISTENPLFKRTRLPLPPPAPVDLDILKGYS